MNFLSEKTKFSRILDVLLISGLFCLVFLLSLRRMADYDLWGHLKAGEYFFKTGSILTTHYFNCSWPQFPYLNHEWLFQAIVYGLYSSGGEALIVGLQVFLVVVSFAILYRTARMYSDNIPLIVFVLALGVLASSHRFVLRPQHFSYVFLLINLFCLHQYTAGRTRYIYLLPPIMFVWVNLHAESLWGLAVPAIFLVVEAIRVYIIYGIVNHGKARHSRESGNPEGHWIPGQACLPDRQARNDKKEDVANLKKLAAVFILVALASLINPFTYKTVIWPFLVMSEQFAGVEELLAPTTLRYLLFWIYFGLFVVSILFSLNTTSIYFGRRPNKTASEINSPLEKGVQGVVSGFEKQQPLLSPFSKGESNHGYQKPGCNIKEVRIHFIIISVLFSVIAWIANRGIPHFVFASAPVIISGLSSLKPPFFMKKNMIIYSLRLLVLALIALAVFSIVTDKRYFRKFDNVPYPEGAVSFIRNKDLRGNMFNLHGWGGYLIWELYPEVRIYIDNRFFHKRFFEEYNAILSGSQGWQYFLDKYGINIVLLNYSPSGNVNIRDYLFKNNEWRLVYWDDHSLLYLKNEDSFKNINDNYSMRVINPDTGRFNATQTDMIKLSFGYEEIIKNIENAKSSWTARFMLGNIQYSLNDKEGAVKSYYEASMLSSQPVPAIYLNLGKAYMSLGDLDNAERSFEKAVEIQDEKNAYEALWRIYILQGRTNEAELIYKKYLKNK